MSEVDDCWEVITPPEFTRNSYQAPEPVAKNSIFPPEHAVSDGAFSVIFGIPVTLILKI